MHWASHCEAFYAQWMIRYLHPRKAPWKEIADLWLCEGTLGRGVIVSNTDLTDTLNAIPNTAPYLQRCLKSFIELEIRQNNPNRYGTTGDSKFSYLKREPRSGERTSE